MSHCKEWIDGHIEGNNYRKDTNNNKIKRNFLGYLERFMCNIEWHDIMHIWPHINVSNYISFYEKSEIV